MPTDRLLTPEEAAEYLGVTKVAMDEWRFRRQGPAYVKLGHRTVRYRLSDLEEYINRQRITPQE